MERFLDHFHGDRFRVYNFTIEPGRNYNSSAPDSFRGRHARYPFYDHYVPTLPLMCAPCTRRPPATHRPHPSFPTAAGHSHAFARDADAHLREDPSNVVSLHCKAGKGRAGVMSSCLLVHHRFFGGDAEAVLNYYDRTRVDDGNGLSMPCQRRFVRLYALALAAERAQEREARLSSADEGEGEGEDSASAEARTGDAGPDPDADPDAAAAALHPAVVDAALSHPLCSVSDALLLGNEPEMVLEGVRVSHAPGAWAGASLRVREGIHRDEAYRAAAPPDGRLAWRPGLPLRGSFTVDLISTGGLKTRTLGFFGFSTTGLLVHLVLRAAFARQRAREAAAAEGGSGANAEGKEEEEEGGGAMKEAVDAIDGAAFPAGEDDEKARTAPLSSGNPRVDADASLPAHIVEAGGPAGARTSVGDAPTSDEQLIAQATEAVAASWRQPVDAFKHSAPDRIGRHHKWRLHERVIPILRDADAREGGGAGARSTTWFEVAVPAWEVDGLHKAAAPSDKDGGAPRVDPAFLVTLTFRFTLQQDMPSGSAAAASALGSAEEESAAVV